MTSETIDSDLEKEIIEQDIVPERKDLRKDINLSQRDYIPTPYKASLWEGADLMEKSPGFRAINLEVLVSEGLLFDPMFEKFDELAVQKYGVEEEISEDKEQELQISEEMIAEIRAQAFEEGRAVGIQEGNLAAQEAIAEKYEILSNSLSTITTGIRDELDRVVIELETKAVSLALDVSKKILDTTVEVKPEYILSVIRKAFLELGTQKGLVIRISSQDFEFLEVVGLPDDLVGENSKIKYVADEKISSGCIVETDYGSVNLELDQMWNEVKDKIFSNIG